MRIRAPPQDILNIMQAVDMFLFKKPTGLRYHTGTTTIMDFPYGNPKHKNAPAVNLTHLDLPKMAAVNLTHHVDMPIMAGGVFGQDEMSEKAMASIKVDDEREYLALGVGNMTFVL